LGERRIDYIVIAAPLAMTSQWQDVMEAKFGLSFAPEQRSPSHKPRLDRLPRRHRRRSAD
jgi:hypothetical protein